MDYEAVKESLRVAYDHSAEKRERSGLAGWKERERGAFLAWLQREKKQTLLEIGAGPGRDSLFFQENGLTVTCTDLSSEMVKLCRAKGLNAQVRDFTQLDFPAASFDALFALNCLLHVPKQTLPEILQKLKGLLKPDGLFYMGVYGGLDSEGIWEDDQHRPQRFFSFYTDAQMQEVVGRWFEVLYFQQVVPDHGMESRPHFQSMILRPLAE